MTIIPATPEILVGVFSIAAHLLELGLDLIGGFFLSQRLMPPADLSAAARLHALSILQLARSGASACRRSRWARALR
jgi:hypothetical protein